LASRWLPFHSLPLPSPTSPSLRWQTCV
jgi:hypothetical protein